MTIEHRYLREKIMNLKSIVDSELKDRPNLYEGSSDPLRDYDKLMELIEEIDAITINSEKP